MPDRVQRMAAPAVRWVVVAAVSPGAAVVVVAATTTKCSAIGMSAFDDWRDGSMPFKILAYLSEH